MWIPTPPHLVKYLKHHHSKNANGFLILTNKVLLLPKTTSGGNHNNYFTSVHRKRNYPWMPVAAQTDNLSIFYNFIQVMDKRFRDEMCDRVYNGVLPPVNRSAAAMLRDFLDDYEITASEYDRERAYKMWQRSSKYKKLKIHERSIQTNQWKQ